MKKPENSFHIYTMPLQPATRFVDNNMSPPMTFESGPRKLWCARCCNVLRIAANLEVQVFYDDVRFWCRKGQGCKA